MEYDWILDRGYLPYTAVRLGTRQLLRARQAELNSRSLTAIIDDKLDYVAQSRTRPIALATDSANAQHYEVSAGVFTSFMGPRMKYSCALYATGKETLAEAELAMLEQYFLKAELKDGMKILDLGCGWGSATLFFAERLPNSQIVGFSNSKRQKEYIEAEAAKRKIDNVEILTGDIVSHEFEPEQFDRVVSVELFEHMKNYEALMAKIARSLKPGGKLFVQYFCHRDTPYDFVDGWMARYFFTGGTMPSFDLLLYFQQDLTLQRQWWISGINYTRTLEAWLAAWIKNKKLVWPHLIETYGEKDAEVWYNRWWVYFIGGAEFFSSGRGNVWGISHNLFEKPTKV